MKLCCLISETHFSFDPRKEEIALTDMGTRPGNSAVYKAVINPVPTDFFSTK